MSLQQEKSLLPNRLLIGMHLFIQILSLHLFSHQHMELHSIYWVRFYLASLFVAMQMIVNTIILMCYYGHHQ